MFAEADLLGISGLQHLAFCERQWALMYLEAIWEENRLTAEGRLLHEKVDSEDCETRAGVRIVRSLPLRSLKLGLTGVADVVEFPLEGGPPCPVEYKRGRPKSEPWDEVQLCAQAMCLEEMLRVDVPRGAIFYAATRRRLPVDFSEDLRRHTESLAARMHALFEARLTPLPVWAPRCRNCSLVEVCRPKALTEQASAEMFLRRALAASLGGGASNFGP